MGKKILKNVEPLIRAYLGDAFCYSIIGEEAFGTGWVYDKYIHLEYTSDDGQVKYADYGYYDFVPDQGVFIKSFYQVAVRMCNQERICRIIQEMLDHDEYFFALWDENVITNYLYDREEPGIFEHGCFLYGYDEEQEVFYSQGYLKDEKWERVTIPYHVFYKALSYFPEKGEIDFIGYRLVKDYVWDFDGEKIRREICSYENPTESRGRILDVSAERAFFEGICRGAKVHEPSLYCMYEHKQIMQRRLDFLLEKGLINDRGELSGQIEELLKGYRKLLLMGVSYNLRWRETLIREMVDLADELLEREKEFMRKLQTLQ